VAAALASRPAWLDLFQGVVFPEPHYLLAFVGATEEQQTRAAAAAASQGFQRTLTLAGALAGFARAAAAQPHLRFVGRDAVAAALGAGPEGLPWPRATVIDVRRSDERALYGAIKGTAHVPVDQLPAALALPPELFAEQYRFPKPRAGDLVIMSCRTNTRAAWAAQLAQDAGLRRAVVYRQGVYGWRLDPAVKAYRAYKLLDPPPEPEAFQVEAADLAVGAAELETV
jgi:rhodanese-related sulfurtransferase